ncbi:MAG: hypothetical protein AUH85_11930 [Chloroflexi bacterium 13_1_40CM_4_68_4]|nr:MAG: hypothetical protein AUH85_11930 [Chloroflexi bacterium 13_1_40CM_4_68_4]
MPKPLAVVLARRTLASLVELVLRHCDIETASTPSVPAARALLDDPNAALLIVDSAVGPAAAELVRRLRPERFGTMALVDLEAGGSSSAAFTSGADDVLRLPFTPDELAIRAAVLLGRLGRPTKVARTGALAHAALNLDEHVSIDATRVALTPSLNSLLYVLGANIGRPVTLGDVRRLTWGMDREGNAALLGRTVAELGRRLGPRFNVRGTRAGIVLSSVVA